MVNIGTEVILDRGSRAPDTYGKGFSMITGSQLRAARALLDWTQEQLATESGVTERTIRSLEDNKTRPFERTADRLREALEAAGVTFLDTASGVGVLLNHPRDQE